MGPGYYVQTAPTMTIPQGQEVLGHRTLLPGDKVTSALVGYGAAARLKSNATFTALDREYVFTGEEVLPLARFNTNASPLLPSTGIVFCGTTDFDEGRGFASMATMGLSNLFRSTSVLTQLCFVDPERDELAESVILVGARSEDDLAPIAISPVGYSVATFVPMDSDSEIRVVYRDTGNASRNDVEFEIQLYEQGEQREFANMRHRVKLDALPQDISLAGSGFRVLSHDPGTRAVTIDLHTPIPAAAYEFRSIYAPR